MYHFLHLYTTNNPENQNFQKLKKTLEDIVTLHRSNINDDHMMIWSVTDRICCHFGPFLPFHRVAVKYETLHETRNKFGIQNTEKIIRNGKTQNISRTGRTVKHGT